MAQGKLPPRQRQVSWTDVTQKCLHALREQARRSLTYSNKTRPSVELTLGVRTKRGFTSISNKAEVPTA